MKQHLKDEIIKHAASRPNEEVCGVIVMDLFGDVKVIPQKNNHEDRSSGFSIDMKSFREIEKKYEIIAIYHSHHDECAAPSIRDMEVSDLIKIPYYIYSLIEDDFYLYIPEGFQKELMGRIFVEDIFNCVTFVKNYFEQKLGVEWKYAGDFFEIKERGKANRVIIRAIQDSGFEEVVDKKDIKKHDLIIFKGMGSDMFLHLGVYVGEGDFAHHEENKLSRHELYDQKYQRLVYKIYRYKEKND